MRTTLGRPFWTLWSSYATSNLGDGLNLVAFPLLALALTDGATGVAIISAFRYLPFLVIGLPAGVILDRFGRRRVIIIAQAVRALALLIPVIVVATGWSPLALLALSGFVVGSSEVFTDGGIPALVRNVVADEHLELANARLGATEMTANAIVGPPIGAALFVVDPTAPFLASLALYGASASLLVPLGRVIARGARHHDDGDEEVDFSLAELTAGLRYVLGHPVVRPLAFAVALFSFVGTATETVLVILVVDELELSSFAFGLVATASAVTAVAMSFVVTRVIGRWGHAASMRFAVVTYALASILFGVAPGFGLLIVASAVEGVSMPAWNVVSSTVRQRLVPDRVFGRMMTAYLFVAWSMQPVGALVAGLVADRWGADRVFYAAAVIVGSLLVVARPLFRRITAAMADPTTVPG
ncbi:MAG: MFS transporter [Actinomycetota bacterium]